MKEYVFSVIGLYLTLFGLLGSLFAIHLANWFREMLAVEQKYEQNKNKDNPEEKTAVRECRYKLRELYNHVTWIVSVILTGFLVFVFFRGARLITPHLASNEVAGDVACVASMFFLLYLGLTLFFLVRGYVIGSRLDKYLNPPAS